MRRKFPKFMYNKKKKCGEIPCVCVLSTRGHWIATTGVMGLHARGLHVMFACDAAQEAVPTIDDCDRPGDNKQVWQLA
jgi:hypothetical protein